MIAATEVLLTREEAIEFFLNQLESDSPKDSHLKSHGRSSWDTSIDTWHYGRCELYDLIDAIYGGKDE